MKQRLLPALFILALAILQGCKKDKDEPAKEQETVGVYVLCEGTMNMNNSAISFYDFKTGQADPNFFQTVNGRTLGETANDLKLYGNKLYCVVTGMSGSKKSFVEVIDPSSGKSIKTIDFNGATSGFMPRYITFDKNKAYVSAYDGKIRRIDTTSLSVDAEVQAGGLMEDIVAANNKLYVVNTYRSDLQNVPVNSISVVDIASFKKLKEIAVNDNPVTLAATKDGQLYVTCNGIWTVSQPSYQAISTKTDAVIKTYNNTLSSLTISGDKGYVFANYTSVKLFDPTTGELGNDFIADGTKLKGVYGVSTDPLAGGVLITDPVNYVGAGIAYHFTPSGSLSFSFQTGTNPSKAVFIYANKK